MPSHDHPAIDQYAVIGNPIAHSKSPFLHTAFAAQCQQVLHYRAILAPVDQFATTLKQFISQGGRGANITLPFKLDAFQACTELTARARAAGAVNTLQFDGDTIKGDNTDGFGLVRDITDNAGVTLRNRRILLLGAGGAARGALLPLMECHPSELVIANRTEEKAQQLASDFGKSGNISYNSFADLQGPFDIIINATSSSINQQRPPVPASVYQPTSLAYDMMYGEHPTPFLQHAATQHAQTRNGWGMLVEQAAEAFYIWRGVRPDTSRFLQPAD